MNKSLLFVIAILAATPACKSKDTIDSEDVNEAKIHRTYSVKFSAISGNLDLTAEFRVGGDTGTTVKLSDPAKVTVDGQTMEVATSDISGTYYYWRSKPAAPAASYKFTWTRGDGKVVDDVVNSIALATVSSPADGESVSKAAGLTVTFAPALTVNGESMYIYLSPNTADSLGKPGASDLATTGNTVRLDPTEIDKVETGPVRFHLDHTDKGRVPAGDGVMEGSYVSSSDSDYFDLTLTD